MFIRSQAFVLDKRITGTPQFIQVVMGPRQVGKTTLITQFLKKYTFPTHFAAADAVPSANITWIEQQWEVARIKLKTSGAPELMLVIDEIQKIAQWSEIVKKLWDEDSRNAQPVKVILLGSSRLLLQQGLTESLAGRFETIYMGHWSLSEMHEAFGWEAGQYVWFGGYPGAAGLIAEEERWKEYVKNSLIDTTLSKDILMMTRVDKPAMLKRLFELGCLYSGQILSYNKMLGQLLDAGNTTTLSHYLDLLDATGLLGGIEKYTKNIIRQRSSSPKFQVYNNALVSAQQQSTFQEIRLQSDQWGRWVESAIGAHLMNHSRMSNLQLFYWRHRNDEVDFVLGYRGKVIGLEVKSGAQQKTSGMKAFQTQMHPDKVLLVGKDGLPWEEFLQIDPIELF